MKHVLCFVFGLSLSLSGQTHLDSLVQIWNNPKQADSTRVHAYSRYIEEGHVFSNPDTAVFLSKALHAFAKLKNYPKAAAEGYKLEGSANYFLGNYPKAITCFQRSLQIYRLLGDKKGIASNLNLIGLVYSAQGLHPAALEYHQKSLALNEALGDKREIANNLNAIGLVYDYQGNLSRAMWYYKKCLEIYEELGDKQGIAGRLTNIGNLYADEGNYDLALTYYQKAMVLNKETGNKNWLAANLMNIGSLYGERLHFSEAISYCFESLSIRKEIGDKSGIAISVTSIGLLYQTQSNHKKAIEFCLEGLALAEEIGALDWQNYACECLYKSHKELGEGNQALRFFEQMVGIRDSMFNEENTKELTRLEMRYKFDKEQAAEKADQEKREALVGEELERQKLVRNGFMGGFLVVALFAGVFFRQRNSISKEHRRCGRYQRPLTPWSGL